MQICWAIHSEHFKSTNNAGKQISLYRFYALPIMLCDVGNEKQKVHSRKQPSICFDRLSNTHWKSSFPYCMCKFVYQ